MKRRYSDGYNEDAYENFELNNYFWDDIQAESEKYEDDNYQDGNRPNYPEFSDRNP